MKRTNKCKPAVQLLRKKRSHYRAFKHLAFIGIRCKLDVWIGTVYWENGDGSDTLKKLVTMPHEAISRVIKNADLTKRVGMVWLHRHMPLYHFEIVETNDISRTAVKNGRVMAKLFPEIRSIVVGSDRLCTMVRKQCRTGLWGYWDTITFRDLEEYFDSFGAKTVTLQKMDLQQESRIFQENAVVAKRAVDFRKGLSPEKPRHCTLQLIAPKITKEIRPGQFVAIVEESIPPIRYKTMTYNGTALPPMKNVAGFSKVYLLRRPFGVHRIHSIGSKVSRFKYTHNIPASFLSLVKGGYRDRFDILFKIVGRGSEALSNLKEGAVISVLGPLGNGISDVPLTVKLCYLIAGGIGIAPLYSIAEHLRWLGIRVILIAGAEENLPFSFQEEDAQLEAAYADAGVKSLVREFEEIGCDVKTVTASKGEGTSVDELERVLEKDKTSSDFQKERVRMYSCGPWNMMKAVAAIAKREGIECEVLLEKRMACCVGTCLSCVCDAYEKRGEEYTDRVIHKKVCSDGPVFNSKEVVW